MPPAARVTDMHTCPMFNGPVPHVGGPILPPGVPVVLIGGLPAACMGDLATCVGPPDVIAKGSSSVFIAGRPAARMGDTTAHGGFIAIGLPTVLIGDAATPAGAAIPGGGLGAHESRFPKDKEGHTLAKHVGKTEEEMRDRQLNENKKTISSFDDYTVAEDVVATALATDKTAVATWLSGKNYFHEITVSMPSPVGTCVKKGMPAAPSNKAIVVLHRRPPDGPGKPDRFVVKTAYPTP